MEAVVAGGKGSGMPAFGDDLTDAEIAAVVRYIREVL
jgi:mono/diheme cytochrome c family protein